MLDRSPLPFPGLTPALDRDLRAEQIRQYGRTGEFAQTGDYDIPWPPSKILVRIVDRIPQEPGLVPAYAWECVDDTFQATAGGVGLPTDEFFSTTAYDPAYERSGSPLVPIDGSAIVEITRGGAGDWIFVWPEPRVLAKITGGDGPQYDWEEWYTAKKGGSTGFLVADGAQSTLLQVTGGRHGTTTINPAYEMNGLTGLTPGIFVWLRRGYGEAADTLVQEVQVGGGVNYEIQTFYVDGAVGGTFSVTVYTVAGDQPAKTAPIPFDADRTAVSNAINAVSINLTAGYNVQVLGDGTIANPFAVIYNGGDGKYQYPLLVMDPTQLVGIQEWLFDGRVVYKVECVEGELIEYVSYDGGATWKEYEILLRPLTYYEGPSLDCYRDGYIHRQKRLLTVGGCAGNSVGPWIDLGSICVPCGCSGSGSGSGSGLCVSVVVPCCVNPLPCQLCVQVTHAGALNGDYLGVYNATLGVWAVTIGTCTAYFACNPDTGSLFQISIGTTLYNSASDQCTWLLATFTSVDLSSCGGSNGATIQVSTGPCEDTFTTSGSGKSGGGSKAITSCCPNPLPRTLCISVVGKGVSGMFPPPLFDCTCLNGDYTLTLNGIGAWVSPIVSLPCAPSPTHYRFELTCDPSVNTWSMSVIDTNSGFTVVESAPLTCRPVSATFTYPQGVMECLGSAVITLNECGESNNIIGSPCCPNVLLPDSVVGAFGGGLSGLGNVTLNYVPADNAWEGFSSACGGANVLLECRGGWIMYVVTGINDGANGTAGAASRSASCSPFVLSFNLDVSGGDCPGAATCTVS